MRLQTEVIHLNTPLIEAMRKDGWHIIGQMGSYTVLSYDTARGWPKDPERHYEI